MELRHLIDRVRGIIQDRLPELRQAITRVEDKLSNNPT
jgi:hypothetical protein